MFFIPNNIISYLFKIKLSGDLNQSINRDRWISKSQVSFKEFLSLFGIYVSNHQSSLQSLEFIIVILHKRLLYFPVR